MNSALSSAASSLALLYDTAALPLCAVQVMLTVITISLGSLTQVSHTARTVLSDIRRICAERNLDFHAPKHGSNAKGALTADHDWSLLGTRWDAEFTKEIVQEYRIRYILNSTLGEADSLNNSTM